LGFGVWGLGFGVWGLGSGVWGLGFGVWGLGSGLDLQPPVPHRHLQKRRWKLRGERERDNRLPALRTTRAHTVGYIGGCDQEQGEIKSPCGEREELRCHTPHFKGIS